MKMLSLTCICASVPLSVSISSIASVYSVHLCRRLLIRSLLSARTVGPLSLLVDQLHFDPLSLV